MHQTQTKNNVNTETNSSMNKSSVYIGSNLASFDDKDIKGELVNFDSEDYYKIANSDQMRTVFYKSR